MAMAMATDDPRAKSRPGSITAKWCVDALLLREMKTLPPGVLTAFRLLAPTGGGESMPSVLPESLLELMPAPPNLQSDAQIAGVIIVATSRLLRSLSPETPGLAESQKALAAAKLRINGSPQHIRELALTVRNELGVKGLLVQAIVDRSAGADFLDTRRELAALRIGELRRRALMSGIEQRQVQQLLGVTKPQRTFGDAANARDVATLVKCPHFFFAELDSLDKCFERPRSNHCQRREPQRSIYRI